ncbi:pyrroline-5-carboxylate reductase [uncultured Cohaesibacter sp.]|uniref:pyrroline-5-carboxylate reductase n=1 Tax=uncultured Cohaesibacter sp. TaxID=1002546 RepID=UPI0029C66614|nr:pyrroline-5-carboxylate reductase [uncultured Cohaesibacter sp.]
MELGNLSLALVGAGKMGGAMLAGWLEMGLDASKVTVIDPGQNDELKAFAANKGFTLAASPEGIASPQIVVVAVKPQMIDKVLPTLTSLVGSDTVVVSVAAGKRAVDFRRHLGEETLVVRAMPNTPAQVGRGMTAAFADEKISQEMRDVVATLLSSMGRFVWVQSEDLIDSVTAISGSGPAYVFHLVEAMAKAGEKLGLDAETAGILARQTIVGAGELLNQSELSASTLRENVTSPGGTTAAALAVLMAEEGGFPELVEKAAIAARDRSIELSA